MIAGPSGAVDAVADAESSAGERSFLLQRVQPAMTGLIDGSLSTLAPIFTATSVRAVRRGDTGRSPGSLAARRGAGV